MSSFVSFINSLLSPVRTCFRWFAYWLPGLQRLSRLPLPWIVALTTFVVLTIIVLLAHFLLPKDFKGPLAENLLYFLLLIPAISVIVYFFVYLLMQKESSPFEDIDKQWSEGLRLLEASGIPIQETPLVLVVGSESGEIVQAVESAFGREFPVNNSKVCGTGLGFLADQEVIYVFANGCTSLARLSQNRAVAKSPGTSTKVTVKNKAANQTLDGDEMEDLLSGKKDAADTFTDLEPEPPRKTSGGGKANAETFEGDISDFSEFSHQQFENPLSTISVRTASLTRDEEVEMESRLAYFSKLVCKTRNPELPINAVVVLMPYELIESSAKDSQLALHRDLGVLQKSIQVRSQICMVVTEMNQHEGFQVMVEQLGIDTIKGKRFGKGCEELGTPSKDRLLAVAAHACASFERRIYEIFARPDSVKKKVFNQKLYGFVARLRFAFEKNLATIVSECFAQQQNARSQEVDEPFLFGGVYFAGTGKSDDSVSFLGGAFQKPTVNPAIVEWDSASYRKEQSILQQAHLVMSIGGVALLSLVVLGALVVWQYIQRQ
jgi:hypothetical protein